MATSPLNRVVREVTKNAALEDISNFLSSAISFNQGDLCYYDTALNLVKPNTGGATQGAQALGIAVVTVVNGVLASPFQGTAVDASEKTSALPGPAFGVEAKLFLTAGDVMTPGIKVYYSATDAQHVQITANGTAIGHYVGASLTAVAGQEGVIRLYNNWNITEM
jgi:hypothetical protein